MKRFPMPATTLMTLNLKKTAFTLLCCTVLMLVLAGAPTAVAQSPSFTDFSSTTNLTLNPSAARVNNGTSYVLRLTPAAQSQAGSAWFNIQQPVAGGFTTTFTFQITDHNPTEHNFPADGLAFVIQNAAVGTAALGGGGGGIGYDGIPNSLAVEFDTYQNAGPGPNNDPDRNHVGVQSCGTAPNSADHGPTEAPSPCNLGLAPSPRPAGRELADGLPLTVRIEYEPPCSDGCSFGTLHVTLVTPSGDFPLFSDGVSVNLGNLGLTEGKALVGFTAATGALEENNDILSWTFTPHTSTTIEENIPPGQQGVFNFGSFNYKVTNTTTGDMDVSVTAIPVSPETSFGPTFTGAQCIVYDGTGGNCWEFEAKCKSGTCDSGDFPLSTSYDATGPFPGPGFLKGPMLPCSTTTFTTNQITEFLEQRHDPTTKGTSGGGISCWVATKSTQTPYAATVQPPINADGSSVFNAKRGVVPVKFTITMNGSPTCNLPPATIAVTRTAGGTPGLIDESIYTMAADNGSNFRVSGCQYMYNLAASAMGPGTYRVDISIAGSVVGSAIFKLK